MQQNGKEPDQAGLVRVVFSGEKNTPRTTVPLTHTVHTPFSSIPFSGDSPLTCFQTDETVNDSSPKQSGFPVYSSLSV